ncbi:MAG: RICIN domain-containing protein, partial [Mycobacteriales bacterium]
MHRPLAAVILLAGAALAVPAAAPASAATAFTSTVVAQGGQCLTAPNTSTGSQLALAACTGASNQSFAFTPVSASSDQYSLVVGSDQLCVDVSGVSTADNAQVIQWSCNSQNNQRYTLATVSAGAKTFQLVAVHSGKCVTGSGAVAVQSTCAGGQSTQTWTVAGAPGSTGPPPAFEGLPALPRNACGDSSLPQSFGTNFPTPADPNGHGFADQSAIGWEGNYYPVFAYLSGSFFARGVNSRYTAGGTTYCGAMYSFGVYQLGIGTSTPPAGSVRWSMDGGYLPALTTSFTRNNVAVSIKDFADRVTVNGSAFSVVYTRVAVTNQGSAAVTVDPAPSGPNLAALNNPGNGVPAGGTVNHDYAVAVDNFGSGAALPTGAALTSAIPTLDSAYSQMTSFWNGRLAVIPTLTLPNVTLPNTDNLADPGTAMANAYRAAFVYSHVVQVGKAQFSGANNYAWLLNHDVPQILANRFILGDTTDAQNLLLTARISEATNFDEKGANWYWDGVWKTPWAWAAYLARTGDTAFVSQFFHDDASGPSQFGPSLFTLMLELPGQLNSRGYLRTSFDNDSSGTWLFDDFAAIMGLAAYKYLASRIGNTTEASFADTQMRNLATATANALAANESANHFAFLPCEVDKPMSANRCNTANDANWASANYIGQNAWDAFLMGGSLPGVLGDPAQTDGLYA